MSFHPQEELDLCKFTYTRPCLHCSMCLSASIHDTYMHAMYDIYTHCVFKKSVREEKGLAPMSFTERWQSHLHIVGMEHNSVKVFCSCREGNIYPSSLPSGVFMYVITPVPNS